MRRASSLAWLLACLALFAWLPARADTALSVFQSFRGSVNFTGTQVTLRAYGNNSSSSNGACQLVSYGKASATLKGIPAGATILSAQLYWAGSGNTIDNSVNMDGNTITAGRTYQSSTIGSGYNYFSAAADVTAAVKKKGNNTYAFSGLSVSNGSPWCDSQGVVAGFALVVVYSASSEPFRMLNIYEGFQYFRYSGFTINLGNFNVPNPLPSNVTGRIGHITWEGDSTLSGGGENLLFNNTEMTDSMNPAGNQFNSQSNINADYNSYGIDFDAYTLTASNGIVPGSNTATTTYRTGQDLVLLSAEVVAMPYVANADLALSMTRSGDLTPNSPASYTITVSNQGVDSEAGPVTVTDTLPSGLKLITAVGSGWTCSSAAGSSGATIVTCSHAGPLASKTAMATLTLNVTATTSGNYNNTATVKGVTGDDNSGNNSATDTYTAPAGPSATGAVFTKEVCTKNQAIVVDGDGCHLFTEYVVAGANGTNNADSNRNAKNIYLTSVSTDSTGKQVATPPSTSGADVTISLKTACAPGSGVTVSYAGLTLVCNGDAQSITTSGTQATSPSSPVFVYADVGTVTLSAAYPGGVGGSIKLVSRPYDVGVRDVIRPSDSYHDLSGNGASPNYTRTDTGFTRTGNPFILRVGAMLATSTPGNIQWAPSFGKEPGASYQVGLDNFAVTAPQTAPVMPLASTATLPDIANVQGTVRDAFVINQAFAPSTDPTAPAGSMDANVTYFEAGSLAITPSIGNYLGTGPVGKQPPEDNARPDATAARFALGTRVIGRFFPARLQTNVVQNFACLAAMNCPAAYDAAKPAWPVKGAVYSKQPFALTVLAFGLAQDSSAATQPLLLFQNVAGSGTVVVSAVAAPNSTTVLSGLKVDPALPVSANGADFPVMTSTATMSLASAFDASKRLASNWTAPTFFYLRAAMTETRAIAGGTQAATINSIAPATAQAGTTYEEGLLALTGRLQVANAIGAEALRLPVGLTAQYWSGNAWLANTNDGDSLVAANAPLNVTLPMFCTRALVATTADATGNCKSGVVTSTSAGSPLRLNNGKATLVLQQPAPGRLNGTIDYQVGGGNAAVWLPSTQARASFGLYKAPVIYLREVY